MTETGSWSKMTMPENSSRRWPFFLISFFAIALAVCCQGRGDSAAPESPATADIAARANQPEGIRIDFSTADDANAGNSFGVFIGINEYPGLPGHSLDGCVQDAINFRGIFTSTFGVKRYAMLTNGQATRAAIGQVLETLVAQVGKLRAKSSDPITVVITYSGHGSRVRRTVLNEQNPADKEESSWIASDAKSMYDSSADVRASELYKVHSALAELHAQVIFISDACHSGSGFRAFAKARGLNREQLPEGPKTDLFPSIKARDPSTQSTASAGAKEPLPGFVWYSSCGNSQVAFEAIDDHQVPCGRLSYVMRQLLPEVASKTTYGELAARIATKFAADYPDQRPEFHAAAAKMTERFFKGGNPPLHARIKPGTLTDTSADLTMGSMQGVSANGRFTFYDNSDDLESHKNPIAQAEISHVDAFSCTVKLPTDAKVSATACAELETTRMDDFVVGLDGPVPNDIAAKMQELDKNKQISFARDGGRYDVALHYFPETNQIGIYPASSLPPDSGDSKKPLPQPLRPLIAVTKPADVELVATNLLYVARIRRLMGLEHRSSLRVEAEVVSLTEAPPVASPAASQDAALSGITRIAAGERFVLRFTNNERVKLYLTVITVNRDGTLEILYPDKDEDPRPLNPRETIEFPSGLPFRAKIDNIDSAKKAGGFERTMMKIIASEDRIDFGPLAEAPPTTGKTDGRGGLGSQNPLFDIVRDAMHGTTRGVGRDKGAGIWTTSEVTFDVTVDPPGK